MLNSWPTFTVSRGIGYSFVQFMRLLLFIYDRTRRRCIQLCQRQRRLIERICRRFVVGNRRQWPIDLINFHVRGSISKPWQRPLCNYIFIRGRTRRPSSRNRAGTSPIIRVAIDVDRRYFRTPPPPLESTWHREWRGSS